MLVSLPMLPRGEVKMPMIWVAGLHRSGTSLLQFLVGALPGHVALGEISTLIASPQMIARAGDSFCSCGTSIAECSFWGELLPRLNGDGDYAPVLEHFEKYYPGQVPVDSSKDVAVLRQVPDVRVLFCVRDVREWSVSEGRQSVRGFLSWYRRNRELLAKVRDRDRLIVGYPELALRTEESFRRVAEFLGISDPPDCRNFGRAEHHAVHTAMKNQPEKMKGVLYDYRWYRETKWVVPWTLLPFVKKFNNDVVYGNLHTDLFVSTPYRRMESKRAN